MGRVFRTGIRERPRADGALGGRDHVLAGPPRPAALGTDDRGDARSGARARPGRAARTGPPDPEGAVPADPDRGVHAVAATRRLAPRPLDPDARAGRRRDPASGAGVD